MEFGFEPKGTFIFICTHMTLTAHVSFSISPNVVDSGASCFAPGLGCLACLASPFLIRKLVIVSESIPLRKQQLFW